MEFDYRLFFGEEINDERFFAALTDTSGIATLSRGVSRTSFVLMYGLASGYTLDQMAAMSPEEKRRLGEGAVDFMRRNPTQNVTEGEANQSLRAYGQMYRRAADQLDREPFPELDPARPETFEAARQRLETLTSLHIDYSQTKERVARKAAFVDGFGGEEDLRTYDRRMDSRSFFIQAAGSAYGRESSVGLGEAVKFRYMVERHSRLYGEAGGKTLGEAGGILTHGRSYGEIAAEMGQIHQIATEFSTSRPGRLEAYLRGEGSFLDRKGEQELQREISSFGKIFDDNVRRQQEGRRRSREEERLFDAWYQDKERALREEYGQAMIQEWREGRIPANMINGGGRNASGLLMDQRSYEEKLPFIAPEHEPVARFLLSAMNRINQEADREQLRLTTLASIKEDLASGNREAARRIPDEAMRQRILGGIDGRMDQARKPLVMGSDEDNMRIFLGAVFNRISQNGPYSRDSDRPVDPRAAFEELPEPVQESVRRGMEREIRERAPVGLRNLTIEEIMDIQPLPMRHPDTLTMNFEENPHIDANTLAAHMAKPSRLTDMEKDYAKNTFDTTFAYLGAGRQQDLMRRAGLDQFDLIMINGQSVRERFGEKYKNLDPEKQAEMFRYETVAAGLKPDQKISFAVLEEQPDHTYALSSPIAVNRGGLLHEPRPTAGQRFLNFLGIRKITPLKEQWQQANQMEAESREAFNSQSRKLTGGLTRLAMVEKDRQFRGAKRIDQEFEQLLGVPFQEAHTEQKKNPSDTMDGFANFYRISLPGSNSRPTCTMAILHGQMLKNGMSLEDLLNPEAKLDEKKRIAQETNAALRTPEGVGRVVADAVKEFSRVDLKKEFSQLLGREVDTPEKMIEAMSSQKDLATLMPAMTYLFTNQRELQQMSQGYYLGENLMGDDMRKSRDEYFRNMTPEDCEARRNIHMFNSAMYKGNLYMGYVNGIMGDPKTMNDPKAIWNMAAQTAVMRELIRQVSQADTMGKTVIPMDQLSKYQEACDGLSNSSLKDLRAYLENPDGPAGDRTEKKLADQAGKLATGDWVTDNEKERQMEGRLREAAGGRMRRSFEEMSRRFGSGKTQTTDWSSMRRENVKGPKEMGARQRKS